MTVGAGQAPPHVALPSRTADAEGVPVTSPPVHVPPIPLARERPPPAGGARRRRLRPDHPPRPHRPRHRRTRGDPAPRRFRRRRRAHARRRGLDRRRRPGPAGGRPARPPDRRRLVRRLRDRPRRSHRASGRPRRHRRGRTRRGRGCPRRRRRERDSDEPNHRPDSHARRDHRGRGDRREGLDGALEHHDAPQRVAGHRRPADVGRVGERLDPHPGARRPLHPALEGRLPALRRVLGRALALAGPAARPAPGGDRQGAGVHALRRRRHRGARQPRLEDARPGGGARRAVRPPQRDERGRARRRRVPVRPRRAPGLHASWRRPTGARPTTATATRSPTSPGRGGSRSPPGPSSTRPSGRRRGSGSRGPPRTARAATWPSSTTARRATPSGPRASA